MISVQVIPLIVSPWITVWKGKRQLIRMRVTVDKLYVSIDCIPLSGAGETNDGSKLRSYLTITCPAQTFMTFPREMYIFPLLNSLCMQNSPTKISPNQTSGGRWRQTCFRVRKHWVCDYCYERGHADCKNNKSFDFWVKNGVCAPVWESIHWKVILGRKGRRMSMTFAKLFRLFASRFEYRRIDFKNIQVHDSSF